MYTSTPVLVYIATPVSFKTVRKSVQFYGQVTKKALYGRALMFYYTLRINDKYNLGI